MKRRPTPDDLEARAHLRGLKSAPLPAHNQTKATPMPHRRRFPQNSAHSFALDLHYHRIDLQRLFAEARDQDVDAGGLFDVRSALINVWSLPWSNALHHADSVCLATFFFDWQALTLHKVTLYTPDAARPFLAFLSLEMATFGSCPARPKLESLRAHIAAQTAHLTEGP